MTEFVLIIAASFFGLLSIPVCLLAILSACIPDRPSWLQVAGYLALGMTPTAASVVLFLAAAGKI